MLMTTCYDSSFEKSGIEYTERIPQDCGLLLICAFCYYIIQNIEQHFDLKRVFSWDQFIVLIHLIKRWGVVHRRRKESEIEIQPPLLVLYTGLALLHVDYCRWNIEEKDQVTHTQTKSLVYDNYSNATDVQIYFEGRLTWYIGNIHL